MNETFIELIKEVDLNDPIFIEALPGIGHVGKLVAEHIIHELGAEKFAELYSPSFPPQVFVDEDGLIEPMKNEFYYLKRQGEDERDFKAVHTAFFTSGFTSTFSALRKS